jgi:hypothetical protein
VTPTYNTLNLLELADQLKRESQQPKKAAVA